MKHLKTYRQQWNKQQRQLRPMLLSTDNFEPAQELFLSQHAVLHSAKMARSEPWSYEDLVFDGTTEEKLRGVPQREIHSPVWLLWHMARIEDVTMNLLIAGTPQRLHHSNWMERMKVTVQDTGNAMDDTGIAELSATIDIEALRAYRLSVGRRTQEIARQLRPETSRQKINKSSLERIMAEGAVAEVSKGLLAYWGRRTKAGLLLMPATRHNFIHLNEALRLKEQA